MLRTSDQLLATRKYILCRTRYRQLHSMRRVSYNHILTISYAISALLSTQQAFQHHFRKCQTFIESEAAVLSILHACLQVTQEKPLNYHKLTSRCGCDICEA